MDAIGKAIEELLTKNSTTFPTDEHYCEICGSLVPKLEMEILGKKRIVQPACKCESNKDVEDRKKKAEQDEKERIRRLFSISNMGDRYLNASFDSFIIRPGSEVAYKIAKKYSADLHALDGMGILIWGEYGNGKTYLLASIINEHKDKTIVFQSVPELLARIKSTFNKSNPENEYHIMYALLNCDILVLDDIGSEQVTTWTEDIFYQIIDGRYRRKLPVLYSSNLKPSMLQERLGARIYDRILEVSIQVENKATSYRREKAIERFKGEGK